MTIEPFWERVRDSASTTKSINDSHDLMRLLILRKENINDTVEIDNAIYLRFGYEKAIMFTDLAKFSYITQECGIIHSLQLIQESEVLFLGVIKEFNGNCLKREGDSLLSVFDTAESAMSAAIKMVSITSHMNLIRDVFNRIEVCVGIGYGKVLLVGEDEVWGEEVNLASKLGEDTALSGEILVTDAVKSVLSDKCFIEYKKLVARSPVYKYQWQ